MQDIEPLMAAVNSLRVFLHRNKTIAEQHKSGTLNFLTLLPKLIDLDTQNAEKVQVLAAEIEQSAVLGKRKWLLKQLHHLS